MNLKIYSSMNQMMQAVKRLVKKLPIVFTQNQRYDAETLQIMHRVLKADANTIDVGANEGDVLKHLCRFAPQGKHFAFEPIPHLYEHLVHTKNANTSVYNMALSNVSGESTFNYVITNPSYSGLQKRKYANANEKDTLITVKTERLDTVIPKNIHIHFIKIDVEGGEYQVLLGAKETITRCRPIIVFEHGLGASDCYGTTPEQVFNFLHDECGMQINLMKRWLKNEPPLDIKQFRKIFDANSDYYFVAS
jgi:FkbM family methyltransferase